MILETVNIFANPIAGRGRGKWTAQRLEKRLQADGYDVRTCFERPEEIKLSDVDGEIRAVITIGGDGTLRAVADRLLELRGEVPPLLPVPFGTANLMGMHLGINWNDNALESGVSDAIEHLNIKTLDAGRANGAVILADCQRWFRRRGGSRTHPNSQRPDQQGKLPFPDICDAAHYKFPAVRVSVDGKEVWPSNPGIVFVGNVKEYGAGFPMLPFAKPDDGLLDICILPCKSRLDLIRLFIEAAVQQHVKNEQTLYLTGKHIRIESDQDTAVQLDGDAAGHTPLDISLLPVRLPFIVPAMKK